MLLIAKYICYVAGLQTDSVDYQVKNYSVSEEVDVDAMLRGEPVHTYFNDVGELVEWRFEETVAVEWNPQFNHGGEVIGFITGEPCANL